MVSGAFDIPSITRSHELSQICDDLLGDGSFVQASHILGDMQNVDAPGSGEERNTTNKVCVVAGSQVFRRLYYPLRLPRRIVLPLLFPFSSTSDLEASPMNSL